jgi:hypothetical protein
VFSFSAIEILWTVLEPRRVSRCFQLSKMPSLSQTTKQPNFGANHSIPYRGSRERAYYTRSHCYVAAFGTIMPTNTTDSVQTQRMSFLQSSIFIMSTSSPSKTHTGHDAISTQPELLSSNSDCLYSGTLTASRSCSDVHQLRAHAPRYVMELRDVQTDARSC